MLRALAHGQDLCSRFEDRPEIRIKGDDWLTLGHMRMYPSLANNLRLSDCRTVMDSVEDTGKTWVRSAGFPEAWEQFQDRAH